MKKILFIHACMRKEGSRTQQLADAFLEEVKGAYEVDALYLNEEGLQCLMGEFYEQRERLLEQKALDHPRFRYAHQFAQADRIVIAAPFWDLSFPALLKVYIENICVEGITFDVGEKGIHGICKASHLLFLTTRGGMYRESEQEMGVRYLQAMAAFWGIEAFQVVDAEGLDLGIRPVKEIMDTAKAKCCEYAKQWKKESIKKG